MGALIEQLSLHGDPACVGPSELVDGGHHRRLGGAAGYVMASLLLDQVSVSRTVVAGPLADDWRAPAVGTKMRV